MAGIKNNLSIDFLFNNLRSNISTKQLDSIKGTLYLVDDILNIKYCSHIITNKKSILSISTIKLDFVERKHFTLTSDENMYSFTDTNEKKRVIISTTSESDVFGIRTKHKSLLIALGYVEPEELEE